MTQNASFIRKIVYGCGIVLLLFPIFLLGQPATRSTGGEDGLGGQGSRGGRLAQMRSNYGLSQAELGKIDPASEAMKMATLGLRGVATNLLWTKAHRYAVSGRPYSTFENVTSPRGASGRKTINGARLPWVFNADLQIDKNFDIKFSEESKRYLGINIYLRIQNLFDLNNVIGVYNVSGDPDNDGFLLSEFGQDRVAQIAQDGLPVSNYLATYNMYILNPGFYAAPRQIFLGAIVNF